jgi:hypothetical protein
MAAVDTLPGGRFVIASDDLKYFAGRHRALLPFIPVPYVTSAAVAGKQPPDNAVATAARRLAGICGF